MIETTLNLPAHYLTELYVNRTLAGLSKVCVIMSEWARVWAKQVIVQREWSCFVLFSACLFISSLSFIDIVDTLIKHKNSHHYYQVFLLLHLLPRRHPSPEPNEILPAGENTPDRETPSDTYTSCVWKGNQDRHCPRLTHLPFSNYSFSQASLQQQGLMGYVSMSGDSRASLAHNPLSSLLLISQQYHDESENLHILI